VLDLSALEPDAFWNVLDHKSLVYPFDPQGRRRDFADIPKTVMRYGPASLHLSQDQSASADWH
jgi:hypothetical protein